MVKKIQCRVIASAIPGNGNIFDNKTFTKINPIVNNFSKPFRTEILTYTNHSGTVKVNYDNSHAEGLLDLFF